MHLNLNLLLETPVFHQTSMLRRVVDDREKCDCNVEHLQLRFATYIVHACSCWDVLIAAKSVGYFCDTWISRVQRRNLTDVILGGLDSYVVHLWLFGVNPPLWEKKIKLKQGSNTQPKATQAHCKNGSYPMENWSTWVCLFWLLIIIFIKMAIKWGSGHPTYFHTETQISYWLYLPYPKWYPLRI